MTIHVSRNEKIVTQRTVPPEDTWCN